MVRVVLLVLVACGCPSKPTAGPSTGSGSSGGGTTTRVDAKTCDDVRARVEQLYRAEAQTREPKRVDEAVADNTAMVMRDCAKAPAKFVPCLATVPSIAELEKQCLVPLDDEGTEGDQR